MSKPNFKFPQPRAAGTKWFEIRNASEESADVFLYDVIGDPWVGTDAGSFVRQLQNLKTRRINLRINSPGGYVFDGMAIYNAIARHDAEVTSYIDGVAASIASVIALAGKRVLIAENAMMMIHDPVALAFGDAAELRKQADVLDQIKETIINTYATRTGLDRDRIAAWMTDETWFTAADAVANKFADEAIEGMKAAAFGDLSCFGYAHPPAPSVSTGTTISATPRSLLQRRQALLEKTTA